MEEETTYRVVYAPLANLFGALTRPGKIYMLVQLADNHSYAEIRREMSCVDKHLTARSLQVTASNWAKDLKVAGLVDMIGYGKYGATPKGHLVADFIQKLQGDKDFEKRYVREEVATNIAFLKRKYALSDQDLEDVFHGCLKKEDDNSGGA